MNPREELQALEDLIDEILAGIQSALQNGEILSDEFQGMIADELALTVDRITQLNQQIQQEEAQQPEPQEEQPSPISTQAPIPAGADLLWVLSGENPQIFTRYLQTFPDPALNSLARNPEQLRAVIERLQRQVTTEAGETSEGIARAGVQSSNVYGYQYSPTNKVLRVKFQGNDGYGRGPVYQYMGVPPEVFKMFQSLAVQAKTNGSNRWGRWWRGKPSLGASFYQLIRQAGYPYQKVA